MPLKSRASEARAARTQAAVVVPPDEHVPSNETFDKAAQPAATKPKAARRGRKPNPEVEARRTNAKRLNEILVEVRKLKTDRQTAVDKVTKEFDAKLKALQDEHNSILFS